MSDEKKSKKENEAALTGHSYDGIEEFDNPLPSWWLATFYGAIVFSVFYFGYYLIGSGPTLVDEFERDYATKEFARLALKAKQKLPAEAELVAMYKDAEKRKPGAAVFEQRCVSCHAAKGQGLIGPNLTDDYWIHGGKMSEILKTVSEGVLDKGMPPWGSMLTQEELVSVVLYVRSLHGTRPPNPKPPQGTQVKFE